MEFWPNQVCFSISCERKLSNLSKGIRSLGPGAPSTEYFPFYSIDFEVGSTDAFETVDKKIPDTTTSIHAGKHDSIAGTSIYDLAIGLQYGLGTGSKQLVKFLTEHVQVRLSADSLLCHAKLTNLARSQPTISQLANNTQCWQYFRL